MILGIGIDIVNIDRIERLIARWGNLFLSRVFTEREIIWCQTTGPISRMFCDSVRSQGGISQSDRMGTTKWYSMEGYRSRKRSDGKAFTRLP